MLQQHVVRAQVKMGLQLYQVDGKSYLLDFKNLHTSEHPDAMRVKKMTRAASEANGGLRCF